MIILICLTLFKEKITGELPWKLENYGSLSSYCRGKCVQVSAFVTLAALNLEQQCCGEWEISLNFLLGIVRICEHMYVLGWWLWTAIFVSFLILLLFSILLLLLSLYYFMWLLLLLLQLIILSLLLLLFLLCFFLLLFLLVLLLFLLFWLLLFLLLLVLL